MSKLKSLQPDYNLLSIIGILLTALSYLLNMELVIMIGFPIGLVLFAIGFKKLYSVVYPLIFMLIYFQSYAFKVAMPYLKYVIIALLIFNLIFILIKKKPVKRHDIAFSLTMIILWIINILWSPLNIREFLNHRILLLTMITTIILYGVFKLIKSNSSFNKVVLGGGICLFLVSHSLYNFHKLLATIDLYTTADILIKISMILLIIWSCVSLIFRLIKK